MTAQPVTARTPAHGTSAPPPRGPSTQPYRTHPPRAKPVPSTHRVALARRRRSDLITLLGGCCIDCGSTDDLEFDHTHPRTWVAARLNQWQRMKRYWEDFYRGHLELRCRACNCRKGEPVADDHDELALFASTDNEPF